MQHPRASRTNWKYGPETQREADKQGDFTNTRAFHIPYKLYSPSRHLNHHTGRGRTRSQPSLQTCIDMRSDRLGDRRTGHIQFQRIMGRGWAPAMRIPPLRRARRPGGAAGGWSHADRTPVIGCFYVNNRSLTFLKTRKRTVSWPHTAAHGTARGNLSRRDRPHPPPPMLPAMLSGPGVESVFGVFLFTLKTSTSKHL